MRRRRSEIRGALRQAKGGQPQGLGQPRPQRGSRRRYRPKPLGMAPTRKGEGKRRYL